MSLLTRARPTRYLVAITAALSCHLATAQVPAEQKQGEIAYVTGGIGSDESSAIKAAMKDYSLALIFARPQEGGAAYMSDVDVAIQSADGKTVLDAKKTGPYLLVKLPPGKYAVTASVGGTERRADVDVKSGSTTQRRFDWQD